MATIKKLSGGQMPEGFVSPFKRVQQQERNDDAFACIAIVSGRSLEEVTKLAIQVGFPEHGPAYVDNSLITRVLHNLGFTGGEYQEVTSLDALPDVAILCVDFNSITDVGRHVVWHHVRGTKTDPAFSYVIDPASWIDPKSHITTDFSHMKLDPSWYIEITPRAEVGGKGKK